MAARGRTCTQGYAVSVPATASGWMYMVDINSVIAHCMPFAEPERSVLHLL